MTRLLVATAVEAERDAVLSGLSTSDDVTVAVVGVGPAAAAAGTARLLALAGTPYALVVSAGIAGGFADRAPVGATVVATRSVAADLGAATTDGGFLTLDQLGFGSSTVDAVAVGPDAIRGAVLTVSTATGTAARAAELALRFPDAVAEAMEGFGVATAARQAGLPFAEVRTIANVVGPRDRTGWRIPEALAALSAWASRVGSGTWL
jgi:futalosine hydrolase